MASIDAKQSSAYQSDADVQASKRISIGLSAHRPTAPEAVQRPPTPAVHLSGWWVVMCLVLLITAIVILVTARALGPDASWASLATQLKLDVPSAPALPAFATSAHFQDTFDVDRGYLPAFEASGKAAAAVLPAAGAYRLEAWPGYLAWSRFTIDDAVAPVIDATATIEPSAPDGAVGLFARFVDDANFFLFAVHGDGRFSVQQYDNGAVVTISAPTQVAIINPAGQANHLRLEDRGAVLRFYVNDAALVEVPVPVATPRMGVGLLATGEARTAALFDEIGVYEP